MDTLSDSSGTHAEALERAQAPETYNEAIIRYGALAFLVLLLVLCAAAVVLIAYELVIIR